MTSPLEIKIVVEDVLSEEVLRKILSESGRFSVSNCYRKDGSGYITKNINGFNNAAHHGAYAILLDLDNNVCAPELINRILTNPKSRGLFFRVVVREIESWVMAHREAFCRYFAIPKKKIPNDLDCINDPKQFLLRLIDCSKKRNLKREMVEERNNLFYQGSGYNLHLREFVRNVWDPSKAADSSTSLKKAIFALRQFRN